MRDLQDATRRLEVEGHEEDQAEEDGRDNRLPEAPENVRVLCSELLPKNERRLQDSNRCRHEGTEEEDQNPAARMCHRVVQDFKLPDRASH